MNPSLGSRKLEAALAAAARGWPIVPAGIDSKVPLLRGWDSVATTSQEQILAWWREAPYNIAIACRRAGLVVLDLDAAHGDLPPVQWAHRGARHGRDVLKLLAHDLGESDPVDTYRVWTPTGGEHRYFRAPDGVRLRNTVGALGWHIDTRAQFGCVIAAGSTLRLGGRRRPYSPARPLLPVAPLPNWIAAALAPPPAATRPMRTSGGLILSRRRASAYSAAAVEGETKKVRAAKPGTRANTLFVAATRLGQLVGSGWLDESDAVDALLAAASGFEGVQKWKRGESLRHVKNGMALGIREPRELPDIA